ncbi:lipoprotein-releasing ABC transporter permease subunit [Candidatus Enterovibrio escicola]|uniref:Lipoprotein releasing system transmembrane protein LolC n=1 Tax=Candidatus Enterovibrio escicola TaxID=1927127 RepID=A0A2A5T822_9GAMM|nr:lipoprotein-releasing ABC transporter permease subunit [Candidatus Enterovibrio escacola]PCS24276.1 Lipoprotein releasing system transmembrane protein LolC [Candidatus Enterovibrio escacola]
MFYPLPVFIGLRYLKGCSGDKFGRFISYMSTAGITIGVMALITVLSVMNGFEGQLKDRILSVLPQAIIAGDAKFPPDAKTVVQWKGIVDTAPIVSTDVVIQSAISLGVGKLFGIDPQNKEPIREYMILGSIDNLTTGGYRLVIGRQTAIRLDVSLGDKVRVIITSASHFTPIGRIPSQRNFNIVGIYDTATDLDGQLMFANINDVVRLMRLSPTQPADIRLFIDEPFDVPSLKVKAESLGYEWSDWRELRGELFQAVKMEKNMMGLMLSLIILVAAFNIISALIMVVMDKQIEIAILRTQGMQQGDIVSLFVVQGATSGIIGAVLGGIVGTLMSLKINEIMNLLNINLLGNDLLLPVIMKPIQVFYVVVGAIILSLIATLFPSIKASYVSPAEVLRYE